MATPQRYLEDFAIKTGIGVDSASLRNAKCLSEGSCGQLVVVGQQPCDLADRVEYSAMVWGNEDAPRHDYAQRNGSPTLREVDRLIQHADPLKTLDDVPFFDTDTLLSKNQQKTSSNLDQELHDAHKTFHQMIRAQKPDVIVMLHCQAKNSTYESVRQLKTTEREAGVLDVVQVENRDVLLVRAFHPSTYLRPDFNRRGSKTENNQEKGLRRDVLEYCFEVAFKALQGIEVTDHGPRDEWSAYDAEKWDRRETRNVLSQDKEKRKRDKLAQLREKHLRASVRAADLQVTKLQENIDASLKIAPPPAPPPAPPKPEASGRSSRWTAEPNQNSRGVKQSFAHRASKLPSTFLKQKEAEGEKRK